ncbi:glycosyltransferase [Elusimicrobiota bacterium]
MIEKYMLSVIILDYGRHIYLEDCLKSLADAYSGKMNEHEIEIILVTCSRDMDKKPFFKELKDKLPLKHYFLLTKNKSELRNHGINNARGDIVYFIDDDIKVEKGFIKNILIEFNKHPKAAIIGGPNLTPKDSPVIERCQGYVLGSSWGASKMSKRYNIIEEDTEADQSGLILCNLGFRREIFEKEKLLFDIRLDYNEENHLLQNLKRRGYKMMFSPEIIVYHYRRSKITDYCRQVFNSGVGRARSIKIDTGNFSILYFMPFFFFLYSISVFLLLKMDNMFIIPLIIYLFITLVFTAKIFLNKEKGIIIGLLSFLLFFLSHICYGIGILVGILMPVGKK